MEVLSCRLKQNCKALALVKDGQKFRTPAELQLSLANILVSNSDLNSPTTAFYHASNSFPSTCIHPRKSYKLSVVAWHSTHLRQLSTGLLLQVISSMAPTDRKSSIGAESTQNNSPSMPNGKATAAAPKLSDDDHVELSDILPAGPALTPEEDIMQLARLGDIPAIERLYDSGKYDASYCDEEGITPLHVFCHNPD
jgi:hypothetical protein